jgi:hypothetical protein
MKNPFKQSAAAEAACPPPPPADVVERLTRELKAARATHATALTAEEAARTRWFDAGDDVSKQALKVARDAAADASEEMGRAQHLVGLAEQAKAAATRAAQEKRVEELSAELSRDAVVAAAQPLAQQEADLLLEVATVRAKRIQLAVELQAKAHELRGIMSALGMHISDPVLVAGSGVFTAEGANVAIADGPDMVADLVEDTLSAMSASDLRRGALVALKPSRMPTRV